MDTNLGAFAITPDVERLITAKKLQDRDISKYTANASRITMSSKPNENEQAKGPNASGLGLLPKTDGIIVDDTHDIYIGKQGRAKLIFVRKTTTTNQPWECQGR